MTETPVRDPQARDARFITVLRSRRSAFAFAAIVFVTTVVQALLSPIVALVEGGQAQWQGPITLEGTAALVIVACAVQAASLLLSPRRPIVALLATLGCYLALVIGAAVPNWLSPMQFVVAIALFILATRLSVARSVAWATLAILLQAVVLTIWAATTFGASPTLLTGLVLSWTATFAAPAAGATTLGIWWGIQSRGLARDRARSQAAEREHDERVARATALERARIAQELHDVAGQHLTGLITLAHAAVSIGAAGCGTPPARERAR